MSDKDLAVSSKHLANLLYNSDNYFDKHDSDLEQVVDDHLIESTREINAATPNNEDVDAAGHGHGHEGESGEHGYEGDGYDSGGSNDEPADERVLLRDRIMKVSPDLRILMNWLQNFYPV